MIRQLNQLAETWISLVGESDLDLVGQSLADLAKELLAADFTGLALVRPDHNGGFETVRFNFNASRPFFPERLPRPVGVLGLALESRALVRIDDIRTHRGQMGLPSKQTKIGPFLAVPLLGKGAVMGELLAANRPGGPAFTVLDEAIAVQLGTIATAAVETARLKAEADELTRRRKEMVAAVAHRIRRVVHTGPHLVEHGSPADYRGDFGVPDDAPARPGVWLYGHTKYLGQEIVRLFAEAYDLEVPTLLFTSLVDPTTSVAHPGGVHPMSISWEDAGLAVRRALETAELPSPCECLHILADLPHGTYSAAKARRLLGWRPRDNLAHLWARRPT